MTATCLPAHRSLPRHDLAISLVCGRGPSRSHSGIYIGEDVSHVVGMCCVYRHACSSGRREEERDEKQPIHGHVTSISVLRSYRRLGLAKKLMVQSREFRIDPSLPHSSLLNSTFRGGHGQYIPRPIRIATCTEIEPCGSGVVQGHPWLHGKVHRKRIL